MHQIKHSSIAIPSVRVTDPAFQYRPAVQTNVVDTWKKFGWTPTTQRSAITKPLIGSTK